MEKRAFLAGAAGAIGRRLAPFLVASGWHVVGTTRSADKAALLAKLGVAPVVVDVFDAEALTAAATAARPAVVIHQLTDLPSTRDPAAMAAALPRNAELRDAGTRNLVAAATRAGAARLIAQSVAFAYAEGATPYREDSPLAVDAPGSAGATARGVASLERQVLDAPLIGIVLRYGRLYGPGTWFDAPSGAAPLHVDAAAHAAWLAVTAGAAGVYNIAEEDGTVSSEKALRMLGFDPAWRLTTPA
jgi:nucleoside-diphosphate-sugar epimerase